ncbi:SREBP protease [Fulvivirga imtechensis AK7]|uniref:Zinc metalloprotease n=1 Tax=Fulvivirga imtechensis AK7 TaxID=1237149 RepID=L8JRL2_9BACT|nr:site-2 protease family protein [Fulvivirga imtechensis]ELR70002.1 SREBP protease [Fulvivirga imtechensis AK7]
MRWSISFGKIAGIRILMHWTFLLLLAWIVITEVNKGSNTAAVLLTVGYVLSIFVCVILHEFGHALMARRYGIETRKVTLLPIGGVASMERMPEKPAQELMVAIAGPAVNVIIAIIILLFAPFGIGDLFDIENMQSLTSITAGNFLYALCLVNVILVLFNAIPAFPMDGGRVLRALLAFKIARSKATNIAAVLGQVIGVLFILIGFTGNFLLILIGLFVMAGAYSENMMVQQMEILKGYRVREAMMTNYTILHPDDTLKMAVDKLLAGSENNFLVANNGNVEGILTKEALVEGLQKLKDDVPISKIMKSEVQAFSVNDQLTEAFLKFQRDKKRQRLYPVMESNVLVGVIDMENLQEFLMTRSHS